jgi:hypothetical protein
MSSAAPFTLPFTSPALAPNGGVRLPDWGLIRARGADAGSFLQGQLTNDVVGLALHQACLAGFCSAKGRLMASFVVWRAGADEWLLACSADLLPATLKRLSMFVMRAKCQLADASAELSAWGMAGPAAAEWMGDASVAPAMTVSLRGAAQAVRLPDVAGSPRWLVWAPDGTQPDTLPALPLSLWNWLEVSSGVARIVAATVEAFVPQMVNLELVGGVNFKKGCYPGQEVVARSQYRGTLKRRGSLLAGGVAMQPGQEVFHSADPGQPAGTVVNAASATDGLHHLALVELKLAALETGSLHLGAADGPVLHPQPLPYALPNQDA